ncbi:hypothetical protein, partial [Geitlerinema sp. PCC 9228]|uniref:hypothetical protein n=1 Tax=Geitlerinema sp. PCC 9228 TaxID=111611 RepID=UPI001B8D0996
MICPISIVSFRNGSPLLYWSFLIFDGDTVVFCCVEHNRFSSRGHKKNSPTSTGRGATTVLLRSICKSEGTLRYIQAQPALTKLASRTGDEEGGIGENVSHRKVCQTY